MTVNDFDQTTCILHASSLFLHTCLQLSFPEPETVLLVTEDAKILILQL